MWKVRRRKKNHHQHQHHHHSHRIASIFNVFVIFWPKRMRWHSQFTTSSKYDACYNLIYMKRNEHKSSACIGETRTVQSKTYSMCSFIQSMFFQHVWMASQISCAWFVLQYIIKHAFLLNSFGVQVTAKRMLKLKTTCFTH